MIDEELVLGFARAAATPAAPEMSADHVAVNVTLKKELYAALEREAARKGRTVEEQIRKYLVKCLD